MSSVISTNDTLPYWFAKSQVNQRENNEDSYQVLTLLPNAAPQPLYLLAIADGMGGHAHGEDVSREALRKLSLTLAEQLVIIPSLNSSPRRESWTLVSDTALKSAIAAAVEQANAHIRRMAQSNRWGTAGSTVVLALIHNEQVWVTNLGDSPLYHWQATTQTLTQITTDHTVANALQKAGMISEEMAAHHSGRNQLELYVGCETLPTPLIITPIALKPQDRLFLCSDGISGVLSLEELENLFNQPTPLAPLADTLLDRAVAKGATDNQTLILWQQPNRPTDAETLTGNPLFSTQFPTDPWTSGVQPAPIKPGWETPTTMIDSPESNNR